MTLKTIRQMEQQVNTRKKKERTLGDIKRRHFYQFYRKHGKTVRVDNKVYNRFLSELLQIMSDNIVLNNEPFSIPHLGHFRIKAFTPNLINKDGSLKNLKVDWKATQEYWKTKYPGKTLAELRFIQGKPVLYHENEHSNGEIYKHHWMKNQFRPLENYDFKASRQYSRLLAQTVKDPNRKVFYYG
jgi:hypothetical protein